MPVAPDVVPAVQEIVSALEQLFSGWLALPRVLEVVAIVESNPAEKARFDAQPVAFLREKGIQVPDGIAVATSPDQPSPVPPTMYMETCRDGLITMVCAGFDSSGSGRGFGASFDEKRGMAEVHGHGFFFRVRKKSKEESPIPVP